MKKILKIVFSFLEKIKQKIFLKFFYVFNIFEEKDFLKEEKIKINLKDISEIDREKFLSILKAWGIEYVNKAVCAVDKETAWENLLKANAILDLYKAFFVHHEKIKKNKNNF